MKNSRATPETVQLSHLARVLFDQAKDANLLINRFTLQVVEANAQASHLLPPEHDGNDHSSLFHNLSPTEREQLRTDATGSFSLVFENTVLQCSFVRIDESNNDLLLVTLTRQVDLMDGSADLSALLNDVEAIVWECQLPTLQFTYVSPKAEAILGYPVRQWMEEENFWVNHVHPDDRDRSVQFCETSTMLGVDHEFDYRALAADGRYVWLHDVVHVVKDEEGHPISLRGVMVDITRRRESEEALRRSEQERERTERFALLMKAEVGLDGRWQRIPPTLCDFLGYSETELYAGICSEVTHNDDRAEDATQIGRLLSREIRSFEREKRYVRKDGEVVWAYINCSLVLTENGEPRNFLTYIKDITKRKTAELALRESEQKYRSVVNALSEGITFYDQNMQLLAHNRSAEKILGLSSDQLKGRTLVDPNWQLIKSDSQPLEHEEFPARQTLRTGKPLNDQILGVRRPSGSLRWLSVNTRPLVHDSADLPYAVVVSFEDITESRLTEAALKKSERSLARAQELAHIGSWQVNLQTNETSGSAETYRILGLEPTAVISHDEYFSRFVHEDDIDDLLAAHTSAMKDGRLRPMQYRIRRESDGAVRHVRAEAEFLANDATDQAMMFGTLQDVTELMETRDRLQQSEDRYRTIVETTTEWIWEIDVNARFTFSNAAVRTVLGHEADKVLNSETCSMVVATDQQQVRKRLSRHVAERTGWSGWVIRWNHIDGRIITTESSAQPVFDAHHRLIGFRGLDRDITARIQAEEEVRQHQRSLAHVSRLSTMGEMVAGIAHEVNQPLAAIAAFAEASRRTLSRNTTDDQPSDLENALNWLRQISEQAVRCGDIIRRLRSFVKKSDENRRPLDISVIISDSLSLLQHEARWHSLSITCSLPDRLPEVVACEVQLQQVLINLLRNGMDAAEATDDPSLSVTVTNNYRWVRIAISDNGPGIEESVRDQLFNAFYSTKPDGMGMGLAISKSIIESHDGKLTIAPESNRGAEFIIELPVYAPCAPNSP